MLTEQMLIVYRERLLRKRITSKAWRDNHRRNHVCIRCGSRDTHRFRVCLECRNIDRIKKRGIAQ